MKKVIRKGMVAVLVSPGLGAGWYTLNTEYPELLFHPKIVKMVESGKQHEIDEEWVSENLGIPGVYCGGVNSLTIEWLPVGTKFDINNRNGYELVITSVPLEFTA